MKKILITGGTGFIGSKLVKFLDSCGYSVTVISRQANFKVDSQSSIQFCGEITNIGSLEVVFQNNNFDAIIHLATFYSHTPSISEINTMVKSNLEFGISILELAEKYGCKKFINASSTAEFDTDGFDKPNSLYASTKSSFRSICRYYSDKRKFKIVNLVLYDNYGFDDSRGKIIDTLVSNLNSPEPLNMSPGEQIIYPVHVDDTVRAFESVLVNFTELTGGDNQFSIFCIAPYEGVSLKGLVKLIEKISQQKININWGALAYRENENMVPWVGDRLTHWKPNMYLEEGLKKLILKV
jgi:nucleoside-diphosphate-sugar epimerase